VISHRNWFGRLLTGFSLEGGETVLVIDNGTVYTPTQVIPDGAVLVDGRRIHAVARRSEMAIPPEARRINGRDRNENSQGVGQPSTGEVALAIGRDSSCQWLSVPAKCSSKFR
jgi:hypothetical protein